MQEEPAFPEQLQWLDPLLNNGVQASHLTNNVPWLRILLVYNATVVLHSSCVCATTKQQPQPGRQAGHSCQLINTSHSHCEAASTATPAALAQSSTVLLQ